MTRHLRLTLLLAVLLAAAGCGRGADLPPTATPIPGWTRYEGRGAELWLPDNYRGWTDEDLEAGLQYLRGLGGDYEQIAATIAQDPSLIAIMAIDTEASGSSFATTIGVVRIEAEISDVAMSDVVDVVVDNLAPGFEAVSQGTVLRGGNQAGRIVVESALGGVRTRYLMYLFKDNDTLWELTFATGEEEFNERLPVFEQIVFTFRNLE